MSDPNAIPSPIPNVETQPYWEAAKDGKLLVKTCRSCGEAHHYPRALCPFCFSAETEWTETSGKGEIYSYTVMRRAPVPYTLALVKLAEGPIMLTSIVEDDLDAPKIGDSVAVTFKASADGTPVPMFKLVGGASK